MLSSTKLNVYIFITGLLILGGIVLSGQGFYPTAYNPYINDYAGIINHTDKQTMEQYLAYIYRKYDFHIIVVTIESMQRYQPASKSIEAFSWEIYKNWINDTDKTNNPNALIVVSMRDRKIRIEYGGVYNGQYNAATVQIIQTIMAREFKQHKYSYGIFTGLQAISKLFTNDSAVISFPDFAEPQDLHNLWGRALENIPPSLQADPQSFALITLLLIYFITYMMHYDPSNGTYHGGGHGGGDGGSGGGSGGGGGGGGGSGDGGSSGW